MAALHRQGVKTLGALKSNIEGSRGFLEHVHQIRHPFIFLNVAATRLAGTRSVASAESEACAVFTNLDIAGRSGTLASLPVDFDTQPEGSYQKQVTSL